MYQLYMEDMKLIKNVAVHCRCLPSKISLFLNLLQNSREVNNSEAFSESVAVSFNLCVREVDQRPDNLEPS